MKRKISEVIMMNINFLNLPLNLTESEEKILKYYIDKDIELFFGKKEFAFDFVNLNENEIEIQKDNSGVNNLLIIKYKEETYSFQTQKPLNKNLIIINENIHKIVGIITFENNKMENRTSIINENFATEELLKVYTKSNYEFEYIKTIHDDKTIIYSSAYIMKPILTKKNDIEYFEVISLDDKTEDKNIVKRIINKYKKKTIVGVSMSYYKDDILDYLENIFNEMEQKKQNKYCLKRKIK